LHGTLILFTSCKYQDAKPISSGASPNHSQSPEARSRIINDENQETEAGKSSGDKLALTTMLNDSSLQLGQLPPPEGSVKSLSEKLSAALLTINAKDDLVKQHAKVAEDAVAGIIFLYELIKLFQIRDCNSDSLCRISLA
jgi:hypothetical protein